MTRAATMEHLHAKLARAQVAELRALFNLYPACRGRGDGRGRNTWLAAAATGGLLEVVRYLLDQGAIVNHLVDGRVRCQALVGAAVRGHPAVARLLVERGAEVNAVWAKMTPLDHAVLHGQDDVADYLRSVGGRPAGRVTRVTSAVAAMPGGGDPARNPQ